MLTKHSCPMHDKPPGLEAPSSMLSSLLSAHPFTKCFLPQQPNLLLLQELLQLCPKWGPFMRDSPCSLEELSSQPFPLAYSNLHQPLIAWPKLCPPSPQPPFPNAKVSTCLPRRWWVPRPGRCPGL